MKIFVSLVTNDEALRRHFGLGKDAVVPKDSLARGYFRDRVPDLTVAAWIPEGEPSSADFERFLLSRARGSDACVVLLDAQWARVAERVQDTVFLVRFDRSEVDESLRNFFHRMTARGLRALIKLLARFDRGDDGKLLTLPLRNFHAVDLAELARLCREDALVTTFGEDLEAQLVALRSRVRPRRRTASKRVYVVDDRRRFFHYGPERHARFATGTPHLPACELAGLYRFGCAIDDCRHYNVSETEGDVTTIEGRFEDCHGAGHDVGDVTHLNMFCNDYF